MVSGREPACRHRNNALPTLLCGHAACPDSHPVSTVFPALQIEVEVSPSGGGLVLFSYVAIGEVGAVVLPPPQPGGRSDGLWQHTCFEAFVRPSEGNAYYEFNFSPSTRWAAYRFASYRADQRFADEVGQPRVEVEMGPDRYELRASLDLRRLQDFDVASCRLGLSAVIEDTGGRLTCWALAHPGEKPDFHDPGGFVHSLVWR